MHKLKIFFDINFPSDIEYILDPLPDETQDGCWIYNFNASEKKTIVIKITKRNGNESHVKINKILYNDYQLVNLNSYCVLFKDGRTHRTYGHVDGGEYHIRIKSNPISQEFLAFLLANTV